MPKRTIRKNSAKLNHAQLLRIHHTRANHCNLPISRYFLHYSGHGGQIADLDGDETEGMDNCIFPLDHAENGVLVDDVSPPIASTIFMHKNGRSLLAE